MEKVLKTYKIPIQRVILNSPYSPHPAQLFMTIPTCHGTSPALRSVPLRILAPSPPFLEVPVNPHGLQKSLRFNIVVVQEGWITIIYHLPVLVEGLGAQQACDMNINPDIWKIQFLA